MTDHDNAAQQQLSARVRAGLLAATVAAALLAAGGASPAGASPAPGRAAAAGGYLYWSTRPDAS